MTPALRTGAIVAGALLLRLAWVLSRGDALAYPDEELHAQLAHNLVTRGELVTDDGRRAARMPLYPLMLAPFAFLGDSANLAARVFQALLGTATVWIAMRWAGAAGGPRAGLAAGLLAALDPYAIFFTGLLLNETLFALLLLSGGAGAWLAARPAPAATAWGPTLAAVSGGLGVLTRPEALLWWLLIGVLLVAGAATLRGRARRAALFLGLLSVGLLPWGARNMFVLGAPTLLGTNGGVTLYDGQGPQARGDSDQSFLERMPELRALDEVERDAALRAAALTEMRGDPLRVLRLGVVKFARTWNPLPNTPEHRGARSAWVGGVHTLGVLLLVGAAIVLRRTRGLLPAALFPVLLFTLVYCVFVGSLRYRVPLMPMLAVVGAQALVAGGAPSKRL